MPRYAGGESLAALLPPPRRRNGPATPRQPVHLSLGRAVSACIRIDAAIHSLPAEAVAEAPAVFHVKPVQRRKGLATYRGSPAGNVKIMLDHGQGRMAQVLFEQENVTPIE